MRGGDNVQMSEGSVKEMEVKHEQGALQSQKQGRSKLGQQKRSYRDKAIERRLNKKIICPLHKEKYVVRCLEEGCGKPFACSNYNCLYAHQHNQRMCFQKFDAYTVRKSFDRAEKIIGNNEGLFDRAKQVKNVIDGLKYTLAELFKDIETFGEVCGDLKSQVDSALTSSFLGRIDEVVNLEAKIMTTLKTMKSKIVYSEEMPDFYRKSEVSLFLQQNIADFRMERAKEVIRVDRTTIETIRFEDVLKGRGNLVFLVVCDVFVIGSYYQIGYPTYNQIVSDPASFIFLTDDQANDKIVKFKANAESQWHVKNWDKYIFTNGLTISEESPQTIDFVLPSAAYLCEQQSSKSYSGSLKWNLLMVLQVE